MNFTRISDWAQVSDCGLYTVSASRCDGRYKFQAWKRAPEDSPDMAKLLGTFDEARDAREHCRKHKEGTV